MKKNKVMRFASVVLVMTLLSTCMVGGTFAKYTTEVSSEDSARVARWGFGSASIDLADLFKAAYDGTDGVTVDSAGDPGDDVIAPGTFGYDHFNFVYAAGGGVTAPEVDYTFTVSTLNSDIASDIKGNANIQWALVDGNVTSLTADSTEWGTWDQLIAEIEALDGTAGDTGTKVEANNLPAKFASSGAGYTVFWQWKYSTDASADAVDTAMGNAATQSPVKLKITITATQID